MVQKAYRVQTYLDRMEHYYKTRQIDSKLTDSEEEKDESVAEPWKDEEAIALPDISQVSVLSKTSSVQNDTFTRRSGIDLPGKFGSVTPMKRGRSVNVVKVHD